MAKKDFTTQLAKGMGMQMQQTAEQSQEPKRQPKKAKQQTAAPTAAAEPQPQQEPQTVAAGVRKSTQGRKNVNKPNRDKQHTASVTNGLKPGYTRATIIVKAEYIDKMKEIAYIERSLLQDVIGMALANYIDTYEDENGGIAL